MRTESAPPHEGPELLPSLVAGIAGFGCRRPWLVLLATALSCVVCLVYTGMSLTYQTHRNDLIGKNKDYYQRWQQYVAEFGDDDDMVVVVEGQDRGRMIAALTHLAGQIDGRPELFDRLFYQVDLRSLRDRALLFLPVEQIRRIQENVQSMSLLLEPPVLGGIDPLFGWRSLSLQQMLKEGERRALGWKAGQANQEATDYFGQLAVVCGSAAECLADAKRYQNPWHSVLPQQPGMQTDRLETPQCFFSGDGRLAFLLTRPVKEQGCFTYSQKSIDALRGIVAEARPRFPELQIGLTGLPVLENDEMIASQNDSNFASWLALGGVALLYLLVYRGWRYPLMTVAALVVGTVWALGWLTLTVGHLNILSSAFAVMLIGMGDYGVLWVTRFCQERRGGAYLAGAMRRTALAVGPSILTAAVATAFAFYAAMLADLKAVAELGWIAGSGVLLCALSCFVVMPPLITLLGRRLGKDPAILSLQEHQEACRDWLPGLLRRPRLVIAGSALLTVGLAYAALHIRYDHNLLNMQAQSLDSVQWERVMIRHTAGMDWHALSFTATPEEALALKERYEKLPEVSQVVEVASLVPRDQDRKLEMFRDIQQRLRRLPRRGEVIEHAVPVLDDVRLACTRLQVALARLDGTNPAVARLHDGVAGFVAALAQRSEEGLGYQLQQYEQLMTRDLADDLHRLRDVSAPRPIAVEDLPANLRERYVGKNGKWLLRIFGKDSLWNFEPLERFVAAVRTVDPDATGKPFTTLEGLKAMQSGFLWAGVYALMAMVLVLLLDCGNLKHTLLALLPLAMGMIATLGLMALFGATLNPANMIGFPLILGVGADNGVHVLHDYRCRRRDRRYVLGHATGRGIMVAALTTILGFGTLMIAEHRGLASLGLVLTLGVSCCMLTALVFLPALLNVLSRRKVAEALPLKDAA